MTIDTNKLKDSLNNNTQALFVKTDEIVEGETYPLYGMITKFLDETLNNVVVEINNQYKAVLRIPEQKNIELLKERAFDPGVFVSKVISKHPVLLVEVSTVVFGKRNSEYTI